MMLWSMAGKTVLLVELTVPWEEGLEAVHEQEWAKELGPSTIWDLIRGVREKSQAAADPTQPTKHPLMDDETPLGANGKGDRNWKQYLELPPLP
ncbi:unnamed protein product [Lampetra planeri]